MDGTFEDGTEIRWQSGPFATSFVSARAMCADGTIRTARPSGDGTPDTFFSIPARVTVKGRTVTGFITADDDGVRFTANTAGKNSHLLTAGDES